jgi:hypothetical protein
MSPIAPILPFHAFQKPPFPVVLAASRTQDKENHAAPALDSGRIPFMSLIVGRQELYNSCSTTKKAQNNSIRLCLELKLAFATAYRRQERDENPRESGTATA